MAKGINAPNIFANLKVGNLNLKFGNTIMTLNIKYKKFAINVAIPTPIKPILDIKIIFKITPTIPDTIFIIKSI